MSSIDDIRMVDLPAHARDDGELVVAQGGKDIPFAIARIFTVRAQAGAVRGQHAHKRCTQFMVAAQGRIDVECDDGREKKTFRLEHGRQGVLVPPGIWAAETYQTDNALLIVLCDRGYEEEDYLRSHDAFLAWRRQEGLS